MVFKGKFHHRLVRSPFHEFRMIPGRKRIGKDRPFRLLGLQEGHALERGRKVLNTVFDAQHQFLRHERRHVLALRHRRQALFRETAFDDTGSGQFVRHEFDGLVLHGLGIVEHIDFHAGRGLIDAPAPPARLPQRKQFVARVVEEQGGEGIEVQAGFHKGWICDQT